MLIRFRSLLILVIPAMLQASESRFAFLQESQVADPDELELEITSTYHRGREQFYSRMDNALEFEYGLREQLQTAVYLTYSSVTEDNGSGTLQTEAQLHGVSVEVKYQLTDRTTEALGSALYVEAGLGSEEAELEGKVIVDAHLGAWVVGYSAVYECEMENEADETEYAHVFENHVGLSYGIEDDFSFGLEARTHHIKKEALPGLQWVLSS